MAKKEQLAAGLQNVSKLEEGTNYIVAVKHNEDGDITYVQLNTGEVVGIKEAIKMTDNGELAGVNVGSTRGENPHDVLRSNPDGDPSNNLANLPEISDSDMKGIAD